LKWENLGKNLAKRMGFFDEQNEVDFFGGKRIDERNDRKSEKSGNTSDHFFT